MEGVTEGRRAGERKARVTRDGSDGSDDTRANRIPARLLHAPPPLAFSNFRFFPSLVNNIGHTAFCHQHGDQVHTRDTRTSVEVNFWKYIRLRLEVLKVTYNKRQATSQRTASSSPRI